MEGKRHYRQETHEGQIESYLFEKDIPHIGDINSRLKYIRPGQDLITGLPLERYQGMNLSPVERAYRTAWIRLFTKESLGKIHKYEDEKMDRFMMFLEMNKLTKERLERPKLNQDDVQRFIEVNNSCRPKCREWMDFKLPPYFIYDCEFDGMFYHHEWDNNVWMVEIS